MFFAGERGDEMDADVDPGGKNAVNARMFGALGEEEFEDCAFTLWIDAMGSMWHESLLGLRSVCRELGLLEIKQIGFRRYGLLCSGGRGLLRPGLLRLSAAQAALDLDDGGEVA